MAAATPTEVGTLESESRLWGLVLVRLVDDQGNRPTLTSAEVISVAEPRSPECRNFEERRQNRHPGGLYSCQEEEERFFNFECSFRRHFPGSFLVSCSGDFDARIRAKPGYDARDISCGFLMVFNIQCFRNLFVWYLNKWFIFF